MIRTHVMICGGTGCTSSDSPKIAEAMEQEIVTLKIVGGLSHKEVGAVLHITAGAAQKRYERAIAALREKED